MQISQRLRRVAKVAMFTGIKRRTVETAFLYTALIGVCIIDCAEYVRAIKIRAPTFSTVEH